MVRGMATRTTSNGNCTIISPFRSERGGLCIVGADLLAHPERGEEHHHEIDGEGDGDPNHVERQLHDHLALQIGAWWPLHSWRRPSCSSRTRRRTSPRNRW